MNARQTNAILWFAATLLCIGAAVSLAFGLLLPFSDNADPRKPAAESALTEDTHSNVSLPPMASFAPIFSRRFRVADEEVASAPGAAAKAQGALDAPPPAVTLEGTIGNSLAILRLADGSTILKAVGDEIGGARIVSISAAQVELQRDGEPVLLSKPPATSNSIAPLMK